MNEWMNGLARDRLVFLDEMMLKWEIRSCWAAGDEMTRTFRLKNFKTNFSKMDSTAVKKSQNRKKSE